MENKPDGNISNQCLNCGWFFGSNKEGRLTCEAFAPGPIPENIITGEVSHDKPVPGQTNPNIVYLPIIPK